MSDEAVKVEVVEEEVKTPEEILYPKEEEKKEEVPPEEEKKEEVVPPKEEEKVSEKEPEGLKLQAPEGSTLTAEHVERTAAFAKEQGLSQEQAQAVLERESKELSSFVGKQKENRDAVVSQWAEQVKNDKEIGGENFDKSIAGAREVLNKFGSPELKKGLEETGFGNHPMLVKLLVKIRGAMADDQLVLPGAQPAVKAKKSMTEILYGSND